MATPSYETIGRFLSEKYQPAPGYAVPFSDLLYQFAQWLDCPASQLYWLQNRRVEHALYKLGFPLGDWAGEVGHALKCVGNLAPIDTEVYPARPLILDDGYLVPTDYEPAAGG